MRRAARLAIPAAVGTLAAAGAYAVLDGGGDASPSPAVATAADGRAVFARMGCGSCHHLSAAGSHGGMAPDLDVQLPAHTEATLRAKILDPNRGRATPGAMPQDFAARLSPAELDALVGFLLAAR